jgi:CubicO group peptidase (beta-lactamase class C family)
MRIIFGIAARVILASSVLLTPWAAAQAPVPATRELTATDLEAWLDGLVPATLRAAQTPGAVIVVVKDGKILLEKGYGFADLEKRVPVDSRTTLFRPGSVSKLVGWTAVMQLVEKGQLKLDVDVNEYIDYRIPERNGKSITLRHLMTHTAGFEETVKDLLTFDQPVPPLGTVLKRHIPRRFADPGTTPAYSNYGAALAAYIVERVSGQPFDDYVEQHIFIPLNMSSSSFRQPLPATLLARMSVGYDTSDKKGRGYESVSMPPAGSMAASGHDMAQFMIAHLQEGRYGDNRILQADTARQMHATVTRAFPDLNGMVLGFYQQNINGRRAIAHAGDLIYFHSDLTLFLDEGVGVFISVNAPGVDGAGVALRRSLFEGFADRYYPLADPVKAIDLVTAKQHANMIAGHYDTTRRADGTFLSLAGLIGPTTITANDNGSITVQGNPPRTYVETKPFLWREVDGHDMVQAIVRDGKVIRWSTNILAFAFAFEPAGSSLVRMGLAFPLAGGAIAVMLLMALGWPVSTLARRKYGKPLGLSARRARIYHLRGVAAVLGLMAVAIWAGLFSTIMSAKFGNLDVFLHVAQFAALFSFVAGFVLTVWNLVLAVRDGVRWPGLAWHALQVAAFSMMLWIGFSYKLIDFSAQY